ncbi:FkbM family methyltransferase [Synechocystis sp. PCC 6803]|nr:FkbM family methyltransferase [Synechocystis sp. IPPAS B-1465]MBD2617209.1 FkbM family methyltransferase [Synechocystis sp. FACHB-898]MBD2638553.1 FkbM family methyltransferase [Synechocystis sp. FACHB-908]MBD2659583.1 FkbM family methyltransferase [Synechocystis sp. FACHB-929]MCW5239939.1 FkbM family methyltransferase [Synechocystis sp. PCC 6803]
MNLISQAVGNEQKTVFFECNTTHNISCIKDNATRDTQEVFLTTIDQVLDGAIVNGIKIDVEGFELECLQGSYKTLIRYQPWLCVEFNTLLAKVSKLSEWNVHNYLKKLGYRCRHFHNALDKSQETILSDNWETKGYCNLFYFIE